MLFAQRFWWETVSFIDVMWPWNNQWWCAHLEKISSDITVCVIITALGVIKAKQYFAGFSIISGHLRNSPAVSRKLDAYFSLEISPVLFKHSNFCSRMLKMHSKRPRNSHLCRKFFSFSTYSKAFATNLKSYWKPWFCKHEWHVLRQENLA